MRLLLTLRKQRSSGSIRSGDTWTGRKWGFPIRIERKVTAKKVGWVAA